MSIIFDTLRSYAPRANNAQDADGTNNTVYNQRIARGWGFVTGDGSNRYETDNVALPFQYDDTEYDFNATIIGYLDGSDPTERTDLNVTSRLFTIGARILTTDDIQVVIGEIDNSILTSGRRIGYSWQAIGTYSGE